MKKHLLLITILLTGLSTAFAQPAIDSTDMPFPFDTVRRTVIASFTGLNFTASDSNTIWDFSALNGTQKRIDTFLAVSSTPFAYVAAFSNPFDEKHRATVAEKQPAAPSPPGLTIEDIYGFFKADSQYFGQVGFGAKINGFTVPILFSDADVHYRFPMIFGNVDTSFSQYSLNIPGFGYYRERKNRINYTDGWGTLYLPADTLEVVRIKSLIQIVDTVYLDSMGMGFNINRNETEYKWLAKGYKLPVLEIVIRQGGMGGTTTEGWFHDSRPDNTAIPETAGLRNSFSLSPNPAGMHIRVSNPMPGSAAHWSLITISGQKLAEGMFSSETAEINVQKFPSGLYCFLITSGEQLLHKIFIKE